MVIKWKANAPHSWLILVYVWEKTPPIIVIIQMRPNIRSK